MKIMAFFFFAFQLSAYDYWPTDGWQTRSLEKAHIDSNKFADFTDYAFDPDGAYLTESLLVVKDGHIIYEKYTHGFTQHNKQKLISISKSITGTLIGIAQTEGILHTTHPVSAYMEIPSLPDWEEMKIDHLMKMNSGIDWQEDAVNDPMESDVLNHIYLEGHKNFVEDIMSHPISHLPGSVFNYSTADSNLLGHILGKALGSNEAFFEFLNHKLWGPLGITDYTIEGDAMGNPYGGAYYYLTPRDLAKFGLLQLHEGTWDGQEIYSPEWYDYFTTMSSATEDGLNKLEVYGAQWFLNVEVPSLDFLRPYPMAPQDTILAQGHYGQKLIIIPSLGLIVVRHGLDKEKGAGIDVNKMLELLIGSLLK